MTPSIDLSDINDINLASDRAGASTENFRQRFAAVLPKSRQTDLMPLFASSDQSSENVTATAQTPLENARLLIVVEETDYRAHLADIFMLEMMPERLAQRVSSADAHILNSAAAWSQQVQEVAIFSCYSETAYSEVCYLGMRLMGSGIGRPLPSADRTKADRKAILRLVADFCPTHIVMSTPNHSILQWANRNRIESMVLLSDWQEPLGWKQRYQHRQLVKQLNGSPVKWVGLQGVLACRILEESGIACEKLIPWGWPQPGIAQQYPPKTLDYDRDHIQLLYAGAIDRPSRARELLLAVRYLKQRENAVALQIIGDESAPQETLDLLYLEALQLEVADDVVFAVAVSFDQLLSWVRAADVVVIPGYTPAISAEDLPIAVQMAMVACTPIVACDRAYLKKALFHGVNAMIFPEGNEKSMVHRIERLIGQPQLYAQLSEAGGLAPGLVDPPAAWNELVDRWLQNGAADRQWLRNYALSSGRYRT